MKMKRILKSMIATSVLIGPLSLLSCTNSNSLKLGLSDGSVDIFIKGPRKLDVGTTEQYTAEVRSRHHNNNDVTWSLSNPDAGNITIDGKFTPSAIGNFSIIATLNSDPSICSAFQVIVNAPAPTNITIDGPDQVVVNTTTNYKVTVEPEFAKADVTWKSSAPSIASLSPNGDMRAYGTGDVIITAISKADDSIKGTKSVKIIDAKPESITIIGPAELNTNETRTYDVDLKPEKAYREIKWSFDNPEIATINETTGEITTNDKNGVGTLTAEAYFYEESKKILAATATLKLSVGLYHDVTMSHTIGTGFTIASRRITHGQTHRLRFVSSTYRIGSKDLPTHKCLKKSDIEVIYDNKNIVNDCSLSNNELTIPAEYCDKDIKINVLGGEISDVITWPILMSISDSDAFTAIESRQVNKCFQVGDYKNVTHQGRVVNWVRLIDINHDDYLAMNPSTRIKEETKTDFSFEFQKPIRYTAWTEYTGAQQETQYYDTEDCKPQIYVLKSYVCDSLFERSAGIITNANIRECLIPMPEDVGDHGKMKTYPNYFWPMSLFEAMGEEPPEESQDRLYDGPEGTRYAYYDNVRPDGYQSLKSYRQRLAAKQINTGIISENWYYLRTTGFHQSAYGKEGHVYYVNNESGVREWDLTDGATSAFCPVFAI